MDWNGKLLVFVCLPMFAVAGVSLLAASWEEADEEAANEAAKTMEDPDYYEPDFYEPDYPIEDDWIDAGLSFHHGDHHVDEYPAAGDGDGDGYLDEDMWPGATQIYVEEPEEPEKDDGWPWMTILTAGIGSLTGLISAISALLKNIGNLRRKEEEDDEEEG